MEYTRTITSNIDTLILVEAIKAETGLPTLYGITKDGDEYSFIFNEAVNETLLDSTISGASDIPSRIGKHIERMGSELNEHILKYYPLHRQVTLLLLLAEGVDKVYPNRKSNVYSVGAWIKDCLDYYYQKYDEIVASGNPESITWDFGDTNNIPAAPQQDLRDNYRKND